MGDIGRVPTPNLVEYNNKTYLYIGQMLAMSLVYGGPSPSFLTQAAVEFICGDLEGVSATPADVPDVAVRQTLQKVCSNEVLLCYSNYDSYYSC